MRGSEFRIGTFHPGAFNWVSSTAPFGNTMGGFDMTNYGGSTITDFSALITSHGTTRELMIGFKGRGEAATAQLRWTCDVPPGAGRIEKIIYGALSAVPSTDSQFRIGVYDMDATPTLYTSAMSTLSVSHGFTAAAPYLVQYTPGADFTLTPFDVLKDVNATGQGKVSLHGYVQVNNPVNSTIYATLPVVCFKMKAGNRQ